MSADNPEEDSHNVGPAGSIKAIDRGSVHRICSGQVVLNLATAVKELVENSIDAGATQVDIRLKEYGAELVEVADNGSGVEASNFLGLTLKHHTSKLKDFSDLLGVNTFGFRGEALSSLCALSNLNVTTCHKSASVGSRLEYDHNGKLLKQTPIPRPTGTTVAMQNLFSTLPVRHKEFQRNLKKEFGKMVQVLNAYCIISTGIRISCTNQVGKGKKNIVVNTNGNALMKDNITNIFGAKQLQSLLEFEQLPPTEDICSEYNIKIPESKNGIFKLKGFVSCGEHGRGRSSTDRQFFFINKRPCDPPKVLRLMNEVYHMYNRHQYPFVVLDISMGTECVDVNVTPDKRQIFLQEEKLLLAIIKASLMRMLEPQSSSYTISQPSVTSKQGSVLTMLSRSFSSPSTPQMGTITSPLKKQSSAPEFSPVKKSLASTLFNLKRSFSSAFSNNDAPAQVNSPKQQRLDGFISNSMSPDLSPKPVPRSSLKVEIIKFPTKSAKFLSADSCVTSEKAITIEGHDDPDDDDSPISLGGTSESQGSSDLLMSPPIGQNPHCNSPSTGTIPLRNNQSDIDSDRTDAERKHEHGKNERKDSKMLNSKTRTENILGQPQEKTENIEGQHQAKTESIEGQHQTKTESIEGQPQTKTESIEGQHQTKTESIEGQHQTKTESIEGQPQTKTESILGQSEMRTNSSAGEEEIVIPEGELSSKCSSVSVVDISEEDTTLKVMSSLDNNEHINTKESPEEQSTSDVIIAESEYDEKETVHKKEVAVPFSMAKLREKMQKLKCQDGDRVRSNAFHAKITPGDNTTAEDELRREIKKENFLEMEILGQFNLGFIIVKLGKDLFIVDQHATDEKYNFEMLQRHTVIHSQKLIQPQTLELTAANEIILMDNVEIFKKNGFDFLIDENALPTQRVKLISMPVSQNWKFDKDDIEELIFMLSDSPGVLCRPSRVRAMFASRSCRKSIMIGTALNKSEMKKLVRHMAEIEQPWNCPHGRPTMRHLINLDMLPD